MLKRILIYGVVAGLIAGLPLSALVIAAHGNAPAHGMAIGYTIMLIALSTIFVAIKRYRDAELGGVIRFWPALGLGLGISFIAGIFYVAAWEASVAISHIDFANGYANALIAQQKAAGVGGAELAKFTAEMERFKVQYANPLFRLPMTFAEIFPVGVLVSLVAAALLRNPRFLPARRG
ncbi:MAG: hypothetical protein QOH81_1996 [Sphingomonadales bacterium]|jgi:hypothetical protein|nr:hypothetical protein [Sphingomonadales bacterium]